MNRSLLVFYKVPEGIYQWNKKENLPFRHESMIEESPLSTGDELQSAFETLRERVLDALPNHPYHNREHTEDVMRRFEKLAKEAGLNKRDTYVGLIAALFHDDHHIGATVRQTEKHQLEPNPLCQATYDLQNESFLGLFSNEEVGCINARLSVSNLGIDPKTVLEIEGCILATTFGQNNIGDLSRDYHPETKLEKLLALADILGTDQGFDPWMKESFCVLREQSPSMYAPSYGEYLTRREGFLNYLQSRLDECKYFFSQAFYDEKSAEIEKIRTSLGNEHTDKFYEPTFREITGISSN